MRTNLLAAIALLLLAGVSSALVNPGDISFDSKGQLTVTGWLKMTEIDYGNAIDYSANTVTAAGANWVEYSNAYLTLRKEFTLVDDVITVTQQITPKNETGRSCIFETRLDFAAQSRSFNKWYQQWTGGNPDFTGRILDANPAGADWNIGTNAVNWEACAVYVGPAGSFSFDRVTAGSSPISGAGPSRVDNNIAQVDYPLYRTATADWSPAQTAFDSSWRENRFSYDTSVNTVVYQLRFFDTADPDQAVKLASQAYFGARQTVGDTSHDRRPATARPARRQQHRLCPGKSIRGGGTHSTGSALITTRKDLL